MHFISRTIVAAVVAVCAGLPAQAATVTYVSGARVGAPVSGTINAGASVPVGHTITSGQVTANFFDDYADHYFFQTQFLGGNQANWVYLDPAETAQLTIGGNSYQANSPYEYVRYLSRIEGGTAYYDVVDGWQGAFSINAILTQADIDGLNATGSLAFLVAALVGNFDFVNLSLTFETAAANVAATPIPGALPLFLSALGLLAWLRRGAMRAAA